MANNKSFREMRDEIREYKILLDETDYKCLKHADGVLSDEEYESVRIKREEWRQAIRDLREQTNAIEDPAEGDQ